MFSSNLMNSQKRVIRIPSQAEKKMNGVIPTIFYRILNITFFTQKKKK